MTVLFLFQGLPHYYNLVLSRLRDRTGIRLVSVVPRKTTGLGEGVYETREGIHFEVRKLEEHPIKPYGWSFRGLSDVILSEQPEVVVTSDAHLWAFITRPSIRRAMRRCGARLILKTIPFRLPPRQALLRQLGDAFRCRVKESPAASPWHAFRWLACRTGLALQSYGFRFPDAHVNYVKDAYEIYGSYGVPRERIYITCNSPDTDRLLAVRDALEAEGLLALRRPQRLIHVGRLVDWKRVDLLLEAVAELRSTFAELELTVIGDGPKRTEWEQKARALGIADRVNFVGGVYNPTELGRYLMSSGIYVLAGMGGLSINEAMCFGLPVVCSVCDGTEKHLVRDGYNGLLFRDGDAGDLAEKLRRLLADPAKCAELGSRSLQIIRNEINVHTVIDGYVRAFEYVTGKAVRPERAA